MQIDIIHTNDIHSHISNLSKASEYINNIRSKSDNCLLVDAGDMITGEFQFKYLLGEVEQEIANYLKYDVMTIGNHDFDMDLNFLKKHMNKITNDFVLTNLIDHSSKLGDYSQTIIKTVNGVKIGFISILMPYIEDNLKSRNLDFFSYLYPEDYAKIIDNLKAQGAEIIIALNHQGLERDIELAKMGLDIDLIIGAHSHDMLEDALIINDIPIVQTGSFGKRLGHVSFTYNEKKIHNFKYNLVDLEKNLPIDKDLQDIIDKHERKLKVYTNEVYGSTSEKLDGDREVIIKQSTNLSSLICDSYLKRAHFLGYSPDFAIVNSRGIRQSIAKGTITRRELYNVIPFEKKLLICNMSGSNLLAALNSKIEFQTSNLKIINTNGKCSYFDARTNEKINLNRSYQIVTIDYLYYHELFSDLKQVELVTKDIGNDIEVVSDYIKSLGENFSYKSNQMVSTIDT